MELTTSLKAFFIEMGQKLKGSARRFFMARTVKELGSGGQRKAERELEWNRETIRKGMRELESGFTCVDAFSLRGRKPAEKHMPNLLVDIKDIVDGQSQTDPSFKTNRLYTRLSAGEVRRQLILQKGYIDSELPTEQTIANKLNTLGYHPTKVAKSKPKKKIPQTDAIFERLSEVNSSADQAKERLRISMDSKATVNIGPFSRGGKSRVPTRAADHDFKPDSTLTPFGIFLPEYDDLFLYFSASKITSDFIADTLQQWWQEVGKRRFPDVTTLVLNQDNGPENQSHRTQFIKRMIEFASQFQLTIRLAYYPPYHSKYNPIERCWGVLENHWNGNLLDTVEAVLNCAQTMTWNGKHPVIKLVTKTYQTGVKVTKKAMQALEAQIKRLPDLERWFVDISFATP